MTTISTENTSCSSTLVLPLRKVYIQEMGILAHQIVQYPKDSWFWHSPSNCMKNILHPESPQWSITTAALNANCSPRVIDLALSKKCHPRFVGPKPVQTQVPFSARNVKPTHRILVLSVPLPRKITCKLEEFQKRKLYEIKHTSISSPTYPRLERLAISKNLHPSFIPSQPTQRLITKATLTANASPRVVELSTPQSRKLIKDTYDPFKVNPTTQHVTASDRILALSKPKKHYL